jgi:UDP-N-acetylglucosamine transferase subunit ALG13
LIFVSLGTHEQPFERALDLVEALAVHDELVVQHGHTPPRPDWPRTRWLAFGSYEEVLSLLREASAFVCHAGVGTIMTALSLSKMPVVVPRLHRFGEHVDDHQLQIVRAFAAGGLVVPCFEGDDLAAAVAASRRLVGTRRHVDGGLRRAVAVAAAA